MSALRTTIPRILRPHLSLRYQHLHRPSSTTTPKPPPQPPAPTFLRRNRRTILWTTFGLAMGLTAGNFVVHTLSPPPMPSPGNREDHILLADLNKRLDEDFKVKVLRGKCLGVAKQLKGSQGGWVEIVPPPPPPSEEEGGGSRGRERLVDQLQGAKGLGVERLFWDKSEHKLVAIIWFGPSLAGWPGITHGGAIATTLTEKAALAAALAETRSTDISAAAIPQRMPGTGNHAKMFAPTTPTPPEEPVQLSLSYKKPTYANTFYVIRVSPYLVELDQDARVESEMRGGREYEVTLETLDAQVCVQAKATFAPSAGGLLGGLEEEVLGTARKGYEEFRAWMWPSRQRASQIG